MIQYQWSNPIRHIDGLMQEIYNSIANALELHLSCTDSLISYNGCSISANATKVGDIKPISLIWLFFLFSKFIKTFHLVYIFFIYVPCPYS